MTVVMTRQVIDLHSLNSLIIRKNPASRGFLFGKMFSLITCSPVRFRRKQPGLLKFSRLFSTKTNRATFKYNNEGLTQTNKAPRIKPKENVVVVNTFLQNKLTLLIVS